ncbi:LysM peptidoglycan-binding domain-containing protein [Alkaliphilus serpentinus]|uniref:LysM peptidoglycan-binding domain-containing protein n=1 Tax=Alkaliphilus serpentinus TaxID=1482731 RepID=A0A833HRM6_9FIRM|nr:LysM peptidoglycan-binding domain-containing protein [Alkaliphilus serpentinus]KAB3533547.1 LysM peptidoglycan-binding domain-containing protein [Alkaliphilus serpentinus]
MNYDLKKWLAATTLVVGVFTYSSIFAFGTPVNHQVVKGDTLWKLSQQYSISLQELYNLNPQYKTNPNLNIGDSVKLSAGSTTINHTVAKGDTPWKISVAYKVDLNKLMALNGLSAGTEIYPGQVIKIPTVSKEVNTNKYTVGQNDTPWTISQKYNVSLSSFLSVNNLKEGDHIYVGQVVTIPNRTSPIPPSTNTPPSTIGENTKTYITHTVVRGDDIWSIAIKYGIPFYEIQKLNGFKDNHVLMIGDKITIPVYKIAIKETPGPQYGELLDWWTEAQYVVPIGKVFKVIDFHTGKSWTMKRTVGANHADVEPLTAADTAIMKAVWGGKFSWAVRPIIIEVDNRRLAASASAMPHDIQYITNNNFNGHSDIHFHNSTRHVDGKTSSSHQNSIKLAAGLR